MDNGQQDLFKAETTWFHLFRNMVVHGDMARMGPAAFACYCAIKAHSSFQTGQAFPGHEVIAQLAGISESTIKRHLFKLQELGYITITKKGRKNHYQLREKVEIFNPDGSAGAVATWDYVPKGVQQAVADLRHMIVTGDFDSSKIVQVVKIDRMTINLNTGSGPQINVDMSKVKDSSVKDEFNQMLKTVAKSGGQVNFISDEDEDFQQ